MTRTEKSFETQLADLIRKFGTDFEGESIATWRALERLLASQGVSFTDLGDAVEKLATGGLEEAEMQRVFDAGYAQGRRGHERKYAEAQARLWPAPDGQHRLGGDRAPLPAREDPHRGQAPPVRRRHGLAHESGGASRREKQGKYLLSLFRGLAVG